MKAKSIFYALVMYMSASNVLFSQDIYLLDSIFSRSVVPSYADDSLYFEYDESNRKIKEINSYFYKVFSYDLNTETTTFYSASTDEKIAEKTYTDQIVNAFGYEVIASKSFEGGTLSYQSFDTTYIENELPVRKVFWQKIGTGNKQLLFEVNSNYLGANLVSSVSTSYDHNSEILRLDEYSAFYENDLIIWESTGTTSSYSVPTRDSTIYEYEGNNTVLTILKSYRNNQLSYCVQNRNIEHADYHIKLSYEASNCQDFKVQDSVVTYLSSFPVVEYDSIKSYRFIDEEAVQYRFQVNTLFFDEELFTVEVYNEHFFSNRLDGVINEINSSNRFYSLAQSIETIEIPTGPEWMMYPNPANSGEEIQIEMRDFDSSLENTVKIYDMQGHLVQEFTPRSSVARMPSLMNSGLYYIQLSNKSLGNPEMKSLLILD